MQTSAQSKVGSVKPATHRNGAWPFPRRSSDSPELHAQCQAATAQLLALARSVAKLNPDSSEIGAGRLRPLVEQASRALAMVGAAR